MKEKRSALMWILKLILLFVLFLVTFVLGSMLMTSLPADLPADPGMVSDSVGLLIYAFVHVSIIVFLILTSRWKGMKLAVLLSLAYYGTITVMSQIETWYFLTSLTVTQELLVQLFLIGLPVAFIFVPLAVWIIGDQRISSEGVDMFMQHIPIKQWIWKLAVVAFAYLALYWLAGYYIAWQNPVLREFYGAPGEITPFFEHTANTLQNDSGLFPFQLFRALLWTLCVVPILLGSRVNVWWTALLVGLFVSLPMNIGHILANPLIPDASVRFSHMIETASSTFIFGVIIVWLLHRKHDSIKDLFSISGGSGNEPLQQMAPKT